MTATPQWLAEKIAELGALVLSGELGRDSAVAALMDAITADRPLTAELAAAHASRELGKWLRKQGVQDAQPSLFPGLPAALDVAPGSFRGQGEMTRHDWEMHLNIAQARRDNAIEGAKAHYAAVLAAYNRMRPLLTDDTITTAEALRRRPAA
jgi:hypothetical protein